MTDHDPLGEAFGARRDAAEALDVEAGLAGVHRRNSLTHRAARIGAGVAVLALAVAGIGWFVVDDDDGTSVSTPTASTTEPPATSDPVTTATAVPPTRVAGPSVIVTNSTDEIWIDGARLGPPPDVEGPITDAVDDLAGGLVVETPDAIWHLPSPGEPVVRVVDGLPDGDLDLIDVTVDARTAATMVVYTDLPVRSPRLQALFVEPLDGSSDEPEMLLQVGGVDWGVSNGGAGGTSDGGDTLVGLAGTDGACTRLRLVDLGGSAHPTPAPVCPPDGGGQAGVEELLRATDLNDEGEPYLLDGTSLTDPDGRILDLPGAGRTATLDVVKPWIVMLTARDGGGQAFLVETIEGTTEPLDAIPADPTSVRLARTPIDFGIRSPSTSVDFGQEVTVPAGEYRVVGVSIGDQLNVRRGPGTEFTIEGGVPNGGIVTATGNGRELPDGSIWYELAWPENQIVWANGAFLEPISVASEEFECEGDESPDPGTTVVLGIDPGAAGEVAGIRQSSFGHCVRTVIEAPGAEDVSVSEDGRSLIVRFPDTVTDVAPGSVVDAGLAFVLRDEQFRPYVEILTGPLDRFGARVEADPARVVIDHVWATAEGDPPPFPAFFGAGIVVRDSDLQTDSETWFLTDLPTAFNGFARPFEANISLQMLDSTGQPFEGVRWGSSEGDVTGSSTYTMTTDWVSAWGVFSFEILDIAPGDYTLRMVGNGGVDEPPSLDIPFTVE
ncbi:MAG: hypothetical protein OES57_02860 [Acidimicrobiia bacterium]|nr:hypothetical protein [Acidimicrobiia bacterium]